MIGGLIQERDIYTVTKVPLLGDIPILGYLFKYSTKTKKKTNLLILLTPYIIKDQLDLQSIRERKMRERQEFVESFATLNEMKYEPKVDYRRKRGLVEEINRSIQSVEEDVNAANALGRRRFVEPGAVEYGPSAIESPERRPGDGRRRPAAEAPVRRGRRAHEGHGHGTQCRRLAVGGPAGPPQGRAVMAAPGFGQPFRQSSQQLAQSAALGPVAPLLGEILVASCGVAPDAIERALAKQREEGGLLGEVLRAAQADRRGPARARAVAAVGDAVPARPAARRGHPGRADREAADQLRAPAPGAAARPRRRRPRDGRGRRPGARST